MTYRGRVKNGVVVLDTPSALADGVEVDVQPVRDESSLPTLFDRYKDIIGIADGLPADFAENHDHYVHGTPKRTP